MNEVYIDRPKSPDEVTIELTAQLQETALLAWAQMFPHRTLSEVMYKFNPTDQAHLVKVRRVYEEFADADGLVIAREKATNKPVGFVLTREDVSGTVSEQAHKRWHNPEKVYALLQHVAVEPSVQREGIAKRLVRQALNIYRPSQIPTAYVLEENRLMIDGIQKYGFVQGEPLKPDLTYFGDRARAARLIRFAAPAGVAALRQALE